MKRLLFVIQFLFYTVFLYSQDFHFSQTTRANFQINPAFVGCFDGNLKAEMNWKDQWQSIDNSFRTIASSIEYSFLKSDPKQNAFFAMGVHMFSDVTGDVKLGNTSFGGTFSSLIKVTRSSRLSLGLQGGYGFVGVDPSAMQWGSQYSGLNYDPTLFDGEGIGFNSFIYSDVSAGVAWWYVNRSGEMISSSPQSAKLGFSIFHINRPEYAFYSNGGRLPMRMVFHGDALFTVTNNGYLYPNFNIMWQGKQHEVLLGALWRYRLQSSSKYTGFTKEMSVSGGFDFRITNVLDAIIPQIFVNVHHFSVGMSYDINVSKLNNASQYRGGFELSLRFINPDWYIHGKPFKNASMI